MNFVMNCFCNIYKLCFRSVCATFRYNHRFLEQFLASVPPVLSIERNDKLCEQHYSSGFLSNPSSSEYTVVSRETDDTSFDEIRETLDEWFQHFLTASSYLFFTRIRLRGPFYLARVITRTMM